MPIDVRVHVHHDRHAMVIGGAENSLHQREMVRVLEIHVGVAEVQLQARAQIGSCTQCAISSSA